MLFCPFFDSCCALVNQEMTLPWSWWIVWTVLSMVVMCGDGSLLFSKDNEKTVAAKERRRASAAVSNIDVRNELLEATFVADTSKVISLLRIDQSVLTSRPPVVVDRVEDVEGRTPLMVCGFDPQFDDRSVVDRDCAMIGKLLHSAGAKLNATDDYGWDALAMSAVRGFPTLSAFLLQTGEVDVNHRDHEDATALMKAAGHGHFNVLNVLNSFGADWRLRDRQGLTAAHYATRLAIQNESFVPFLTQTISLLHSSQLNSLVDFDGHSCLMMAAISNSLSVCQLLLAADMNPLTTNIRGLSAISMTSDPHIQRLLSEAAAKRAEKAHAAWLLSQTILLESELESIEV